MDWRITCGLSVVSLAFNLGYYALITHSAGQSAKLAASSIITLAAAHGAHAGVARWQRRLSRPAPRHHIGA